MEENQLQTVKKAREFDNGEVEIDLMDLLFMLLSKIKWIVLFAIVGGLIAGGYTHYFVAPQYEATSKIYIVSKSDSVINLSDLQIGSSLTADYKELLMSRPMMESIKENLNLDMSAGALAGAISISNPSSTRILKITAKTTNPELSRDIANEMAELSKTWLSEIMESHQPNVIEKAVAPGGPCSPNMRKNVLIGAFVLAFAYMAVLVVKYILDDTIHTSEDFEKYYGIVPMAVIPEVDGMADDQGNKSGKKKKQTKNKRERR